MPERGNQRPPSAAEIAKAAVRGSVWAAGGSYALFVVNFVSVAIIARSISPAEFGAYALALSLAQVLAAFTALAFGQAVIQSPNDPAAADTGLVLIVAVRVGVFIVAAPLGFVVANRYGSETAWMFVQLVGVSVLDGLRAGMTAVLERDLRYRSFTWLSVGSAVLAGGLGAACAGSGFGAASLVARDALASAALVVALVSVRKRLGLPDGRRFDRATAGRLWGFASSMYWVRALEQVLQRVDRVMVGALAGPAALGIYHQAKYVVSLPAQVVAPANQQVAIVAFAKWRDDPSRLSVAFDVVQFFVARTLLLVVVVLLVWPEVVLVAMFGEEWRSGAPVLRAFAVYAALFPILETYRALHTATERWTILRASAGVQALALLVLGGLLISYHGSLGGAIAASLALGCALAVHVGSAMRRVGVRAHGRLLVPGAAAFAAAACGGAYKTIVAVSIGTTLCGVFLVTALFAVGLLAFERREWSRRLGLLRRTAGI